MLLYKLKKLFLFRERMLHFVTSQDELNSLPGETQFKLLKKGLPECIVMAKVWGFNNRSLEDELDLVLSDNDLNMFRVRNIIMI